MVTITKNLSQIGVSLPKMSYPPAILIVSSKGKQMNEYTLYEYTINGNKVVSAIHWRDGAKFRSDYPDAKPIG